MSNAEATTPEAESAPSGAAKWPCAGQSPVADPIRTLARLVPAAGQQQALPQLQAGVKPASCGNPSNPFPKAETPTAAALTEAGEAAVGARVAVWWPEDCVYYKV